MTTVSPLALHLPPIFCQAPSFGGLLRNMLPRNDARRLRLPPHLYNAPALHPLTLLPCSRTFFTG